MVCLCPDREAAISKCWDDAYKGNRKSVPPGAFQKTLESLYMNATMGTQLLRISMHNVGELLRTCEQQLLHDRVTAI